MCGEMRSKTPCMRYTPRARCDYVIWPRFLFFSHYDAGILEQARCFFHISHVHHAERRHKDSFMAALQELNAAERIGDNFHEVCDFSSILSLQEVKAWLSYRRKNSKNRRPALSPTVEDPYNVREHENMVSQIVPDTYRKNGKNQKLFYFFQDNRRAKTVRDSYDI